VTGVFVRATRKYPRMKDEERTEPHLTRSFACSCPVPEIRGILPEVSWLFFKARSEPDWR
jgi:hypothetical protein